jgi:hypothetical protein
MFLVAVRFVCAEVVPEGENTEAATMALAAAADRRFIRRRWSGSDISRFLT